MQNDQLCFGSASQSSSGLIFPNTYIINGWGNRNQFQKAMPNPAPWEENCLRNSLQSFFISPCPTGVQMPWNPAAKFQLKWVFFFK